MINNRQQTAESQLATMKRLIDFGKVDESKKNADVPVVEFKKKAANGKTYGIIRESTKYYIMEAPEKNTEVLAEDFNYIGGFNNRRENEYSSYAKASNALDLKIMSINETVEKNNKVLIEKPVVKSEWENNITESMRKDIERFKTITTNAKRILKEEKGDVIPSAHTLPEAPAKNPTDDKVNAPFTETGVAKGDEDFKQKDTNHQKAGGPFNGDVKVDMQSDKNPKSSEDGNPYKEKVKYVDAGVADENPSGGKVVKVNENNGKKTRLKLTLEQVLAWNKNKNLLDTSKGTEIGSSAPFTDELGEESNQTEAPTEPIHEEASTEPIHEEAPVVHNTDNQNSPEVGTNEIGEGDPFEIEVEINEAAEPEDYEDDFLNSAEVGFDNDYADFEKSLEPTYEIIPDEDGDYIDDLGDLDPSLVRNIAGMPDDVDEVYCPGNGEEDDDDDTNFFPESRRRFGRRMNEDKLNVFGKHPAYRKRPMTTPPNKEVAINGAREWDDESAQGEQPFGEKIGDGSPFNKVVDEITEAIYRHLHKKKD